MEYLNKLVECSTNLISQWGLLFGFFLVFIESFIPALPLSVFVTLNVNAFGFFTGILISWIATCTGSFICYLIFYYFYDKFSKYLKKKNYKNFVEKVADFKKISFTKLVLIITLPFTPSFLVNILSGVSGMSKEKYILSLLIGKVFTTVFWGYIGKSIIDSLTDVKSIIYIVIALVIAYLLSKFISKKFNIE